MSRSLRHFWTDGRFACAALLVCAVLLAGCGGATAVYDAEGSPALQTVAAAAYNEGTEDAQYVRITLGFDRAIAMAQDYAPQVKIAGDRVEKSKISVTSSGKNLLVTVNADKIRDGDLTLTLGGEGNELVKGLSSLEGGFAPKNDRRVEALIPSGVALSAVSPDAAGGAIAEVTRAFDIRGIAWVLFSDDGEIVGDSLLSGADARDGAVALHGHDFLTDDEYDVAANLAETLASHFGDRYAFTADGKTLMAKRADGTSEGLSVALYAYALVV